MFRQLFCFLRNRFDGQIGCRQIFQRTTESTKCCSRCINDIPAHAKTSNKCLRLTIFLIDIVGASLVINYPKTKKYVSHRNENAELVLVTINKHNLYNFWDPLDTLLFFDNYYFNNGTQSE
eukprot:NODE_106_length_19060_cov_0.700227.p18 type:complete len:121 gc:universal NODE_106_length_19060_cov_0.700227:16484-16846(+)